MTIFQWDDRYRLGIEEIDDQHKMLFELLADLRSAIKNNQSKEFVTVVIIKLEEYARMHFSLEEYHMLSANYPEYEYHKLKHQEYIESINDFKNKLDPEEFNSTLRILDFLMQWIAGHITWLDKEFLFYLRSKGFHNFKIAKLQD